MEGSIRSGGVLKKKTSSGCLIIKPKSDRNNLGGLGVLSINSKEKKRPIIAGSDSSSSDEDEDESLELMRSKVNDKRVHYSSMRYKRSDIQNWEFHRSNVGIDISDDRKRNRFDLFESNVHDEFPGKKVRNQYAEDNLKIAGLSGGRNFQEFVVGSSNKNLVVDKRKQGSYLDGSSNGMNKSVDYNCLRNKGVELEEDVQMPVSVVSLKYKEMTNEPIRLQGKNGVLKVMVNKKKMMNVPSQHKNIDYRKLEERNRSRTGDASLAPIPFYPPRLEPSENQGSFVNKEKTVEKEKKEKKMEKVKPVFNKVNRARDLEIGGTDTELKLAPPGLQVNSSKEVVKKEEERSSEPENVTPAKGNKAIDGKAKRGGSTEKQMLRDKIRGILVDAGWKISYRPRRNRDYQDAVYINPNGTAYWSIIKAYEAFKKYSKEDNDKSKSDLGSPSFVPENLIHKLTRQTKKKIAEEMKRKSNEDDITRKSAVSENDLRDDFSKKKSRKLKGEKPSKVSNYNNMEGRTSKLIGRCTLRVRGSDKGQNSESDGYVPYSGKRTLLAWLIDSGTTKLSEKVQYMNRKKTQVMLEGWITRDGIHCGCCSKILTVLKFELHAGSKLRQPFQNIFLESGASLLQCQIDAWNKQEESLRQDFHTVGVGSADPDDDACGICGDGGDLICCDSCPSTFHQSCLEIQMLPSGDWYCLNCTCKFCGNASVDVAEENDNSIDEIVRCSFCEKKYHKLCSEEVYTQPMTSTRVSFCELKCQEIYEHLQNVLGVKKELGEGFTWSLIQRTDVSDSHNHGFPHRVESNSKLAVALSVMDECFFPITDRRSGINMIHNVVYNCGSNYNRLNYRAFYTAILEQGDEIISAASIRIHGTRLAEMPFIGTREIYRQQGMCRRLLSAIETELCALKVEQLIIPAVTEHMNTWTRSFGFYQLEDALKKDVKSMNVFVFPGTNMLQKQLVKQDISEGVKVPESITDTQLPVLVEKSELDSSTGFTREAGEDSGVCHETKSSALVSVPTTTVPSDNMKAANHTLDSDILISTKVENDAIIGENKNPAHISTFPDNEEILMTSNAEVDHNAIENELPVSGVAQEAVALAKTDKPDGESEMPSVDYGKLVSPISNPEASSQGTITTENHTQWSSCANENSTQC